MLAIRRGSSRLILPAISDCFRKTQLSGPIVSLDTDVVRDYLKLNFLGINYQIGCFNSVTAPTNIGCGKDRTFNGIGGVSDEVDDNSDKDDDANDVRSEDELEAKPSDSGPVNEKLKEDAQVILDILKVIIGSSQSKDKASGKSTAISAYEVRNQLDQCGVNINSELAMEVLSRTRNNWEAAYTFFLWVGKQPAYVLSLREYHSMIAILAKQRKFDTGWGLIYEMRKKGLINQKSLLILMRRYAAAHDVGNAINTFHAFKRLGLPVGIEEFQNLLAALCRYKNVQDAELLLFNNKNTYPFTTKSFNIILNGWCNVIGSPREGKRFWKVMIHHGIELDVVSYSSIISTFSKSNRFNEVIWLFNKMQNMGIDPDRKVYNAVIHALAKNGHVKEALNLLKVVQEKEITPNTVTYNSLIKPLCKARKRDEAKIVFDEMLSRGLQPTHRTYHAFLRVQRTGDEIFELLDKMEETGCDPNKDTYMLLIRKFCRWRQLDLVFKLWDEMGERGLNDDSSSYIVLIHGLFLNGKLEEAYKIYLQMKEKSLMPDPSTDEMIQTWLSNKEMASAELQPVSELSSVDHVQTDKRTKATSTKLHRRRGFVRKPETVKVVKERGFSFRK